MGLFDKVSRALKNERGVSFVLVLVLIVVMSVLAVGVVGVTATNVKMSTGERDYQSVYYIAEAAMNMKLDAISQSLDDNSLTEVESFIESDTLYDDFSPNMGESPYAIVSGEKIEGEYILTSTAHIGNRSRTVQSSFILDVTESGGGNTPPFELLDNVAVFSNGSISLSGGATIDGYVATNSTSPQSITFESWPNGGGARINNGSFILGPGGDFNAVVKFPDHNSNDTNMINYIASFRGDSDNLIEPMIYTIPDFPEPPEEYSVIDYQQIEKNENEKYDVILNNRLRINNYIVRDTNYVLELDENLFFKEIILGEDNTLNINVGNEERTLIVDHLDASTGHIKINGTGKLNIYVKEKITMGSGSTINNDGDTNQLAIYFKGSGNPDSPRSFTLGGAQAISGSFFGEDTNINITSGGGFTGHIITGGKKVELSGGSSTDTRLFYAPNADVKISEGGVFIGSVITKTLTMDGGASVTYNPLVDYDGLPYFPGDGSENGETNTTIKLQKTSTIREK
nr:PilX N-terminal domain-containing pilus assembly protein [Bacillus alkalicola]